LYSEFHRITNQNLPFPFFAGLDKYAPQLLRLYKKRKTGIFFKKIEDILMAYEEQ
ncbi:sterile alpha motif domain-containing protein 3, partial [Clarias magur]